MQAMKLRQCNIAGVLPYFLSACAEMTTYKRLFKILRQLFNHVKTWTFFSIGRQLFKVLIMTGFDHVSLCIRHTYFMAYVNGITISHVFEIPDHNLSIQAAKNSTSWHHSTTLSGYIFATKACIDNQKKTC